MDEIGSRDAGIDSKLKRSKIKKNIYRGVTYKSCGEPAGASETAGPEC